MCTYVLYNYFPCDPIGEAVGGFQKGWREGEKNKGPSNFPVRFRELDQGLFWGKETPSENGPKLGIYVGESRIVSFCNSAKV